jgi:hypothetical protein
MTEFAEVRLQVLRTVDEHAFPRWVEFMLRDANGLEWTFVEKEPMICREPLEINAEFPLSGFLKCQVVKKWVDERGMGRCAIDTEFPFGIESRQGETRFEVYVEQVCA